MKRILVFTLVLLLVFTFFASAAGQKEKVKEGREVLEYDTISILWSDIVAEENSLYDQEILKRLK